MTRHVPIWLDRFPKSRRPSYPKLRGESQTDVVIIGGGLTGCACALSFAAAGVKSWSSKLTGLAAAATAGSIGLVREDFDASFMDHASAYGLRAARLSGRHATRIARLSGSASGASKSDATWCRRSCCAWRRVRATRGSSWSGNTARGARPVSITRWVTRRGAEA